MTPPTYVSVELDDDEIRVVDGLLYASCSLLFATGVVYVEDYRFCWPTNLTGRLRDALQAFRTYNTAPFSARKLWHKMEVASNAYN